MNVLEAHERMPCQPFRCWLSRRRDPSYSYKGYPDSFTGVGKRTFFKSCETYLRKWRREQLWNLALSNSCSGWEEAQLAHDLYSHALRRGERPSTTDERGTGSLHYDCVKGSISHRRVLRRKFCGAQLLNLALSKSCCGWEEAQLAHDLYWHALKRGKRTSTMDKRGTGLFCYGWVKR